MRILRINGHDVDIDQQTAIGITFQAYDFKEPGKRKVSLSNSFSIPLTSNNQIIIGFGNNVQSIDTTIYESLTCCYWIDNEQLINNAIVRIEEITQGRIKMFVVNKNSFWDELKAYTWVEFLTDYEDWLVLQGEYFVGYQGTPNYYMDTLAFFFANQLSGSRVLIPMYLGNFFNYNPGAGYLETQNKIYMTYGGDSGGHLCTYIKSIFEFIEYKFGVDFLTSSTDTTIIWNDTYAPNVYIPIREYIHVSGGGGFAWHTMYTNAYPPYETYSYADKGLYDLVLSFFQLFNVILDESDIGGVTTIKIRRFDDIETMAEVVNFSNNISLKNTIFKPKLYDYQKNNYIKYVEVYPGATSKYEGAKKIVCNNTNLDETKDLFDIDAYYPDVLVASYGQSLINLSTEESFKTFTFLISVGTTAQLIDLYEHTTNVTSQNLELAQLYGITGEYNFIEDIAAYPKSYIIEKWLTINDIVNLEFFKQYYVRALNGSFFINKISGFNPEKSNTPTKIELVRVSDKVPKPIDDYVEDFFIDGLGNAFVDGNGNNFTDGG